MKKIFTLILLALTVSISFAQQNTFSDPIDLPQTGWNKVLQMSNGNTLLFHLEPKKSITVKVFDANRKEIASRKALGKIIDHALLEHSDLHGIYEVGKQAVLFIEQTVLNNETLVRLCFDANTGKLIDEQIVLASKSMSKELEFHLVHNPVSGGYAVFGMIDIESNFKGKLYLHVYNSNHKEVQKIQIKKDTKGYDYLRHLSTSVDQQGGITISVVYRKIIKYPQTMDNDLVISYLAPDDTAFRTTVTKLAKNAMPYYAFSTHDKFTHKLNYLYIDGFEANSPNGLDRGRYWVVYTPTFLQYSFYDFSKMDFSNVDYTKTKEIIEEHTNTDYNLTLVPIAPLSFTTNKFGMSTLISEIVHEGFRMPKTGQIYANISAIMVTQLNSDREEVWSTIIPKAQIVDGNLNGYYIKNRNTHKFLFRENDLNIDWEHQFVSFSNFSTPKRNTYIIYNDSKANLDLNYEGHIDTVFDISKSNTVLFKILRSRETSKSLLYGKLENDNESYASLVESDDYNTDTQIYCSLVLHRKGDQKELLMCWTKFED